MHFARLYQKYKYELNSWDKYGNIGDCIQNLAIESLYNELGLTTLLKINRDELITYNGEPALLPMQGWFGNAHNVFASDWSEHIHPIFIGYHLNNNYECRKTFIDKDILSKMKKFQPIGCRDRNTRDFLSSLGLDAYFSGCMTLTFPKRDHKPNNGKIFIVDLKQEAKEIIPETIKRIADKSITHSYRFKKYPVSQNEAFEFENTARNILNRYRNEAELVITSRIHCAMPCIAMGIPVIFIHNNIKDERFDVLNGIIPVYTPDDIDKIDWNPKSVDISELKNAIKENAKSAILQEFDVEKRKNLIKITDAYLLKAKSQTQCIHNKLQKEINNYKKVIIWGASNFLKDYTLTHSLDNVIGIIDKNPQNHFKELAGCKILPPETLKNLSGDIIISTIENKHKEVHSKIQEYLETNNISTKLLKDIF